LNGGTKIRLVLGTDFRIDSTGPDASTRTIGQAGKLGVANGNGVNGMARKVAHYLSELGYKTARIFNLRPFNKAVTQIEYRKGYEAEALKLGSLLPVKVAYSESNQIHGDVRLVLGHDIKQNMAAWTPWLNKVRVAQSDAASRL
jgi:hypothetical protein